MRVAIVHDYLTQRGGAERVVLSLHRLFPDAPVYTSIYDPSGTYEEFAHVDVRPSFLQRVPRRGAGRALLPLYPAAFGRLRLRGYDAVISSSSGFAHGVDAGDAFHLCYCYTPPRWLYWPEEYLQGKGGNGRAAKALRPLLGPLRTWDLAAARRPDEYVAVSSLVAERIESVYGRTATVINPPLRPTPAVGKPADDRSRPYFLVVSRLLPYKRVDVAVDAARSIGARLVVVGDGPLRRELEGRAGGDVEFRGTVSDAELAALLAGCVALIQAGTEDFGLMPVEANALGRPVIALGAGGALESVVDGVTGLLVQPGHADADAVGAFGQAMRRAQEHKWDVEKLQAHAESFGEERFHAAVREVLVNGVAAKRQRGDRCDGARRPIYAGC